jgi:hypothetical protein
VVFVEVAGDEAGGALAGAQVRADLGDECCQGAGAAASEGVGFDVLVEALGGVELGL